MAAARSPISVRPERIERSIRVLRGEHVLLDADLAVLYGVETKDLVRAVKRNLERFPDDFMFQLTPEEHEILRSQFGTSSSWGGRRYPPYAFTEHGVTMLSSVLRSERAVAVSVQVVRAFVQMRRLVASQADLVRKVDALERKSDARFRVVFTAIKKLMAPPALPPLKRGKIGFRNDE